MKLLNFVVWLSAGAIIGWFASQMVKLEHRPTQKMTVNKVYSSAES